MGDMLRTRTRTRIAAHRGDRTQALENTIPAFQYAIQCGADMVEFDVRRTADGELIVHHDDKAGDQVLSAMTYEEALRCSAAKGYHIPRLCDVLDLTNGRIDIDVELKETGYEEAVVKAVFDHRFRVDEFVVTSFDLATITAVKAMSPGIRTGILIETGTGVQALDTFEAARVDFLAPRFDLLDPETLAQTERRNIPIVTWTVNDETRIRRLLPIPIIEAIITDSPGRALEIRNELRL